jgi:nucleosome binding factor SPN SPT16 subunit
VSHLTLGTPLSEVYDLTKEFIAERNASLAEKVHSNFGFGIGSSYKEELLTIRSSNSKTKVEGGMVFHVRITFEDVEKDKNRSAIAIGDTVVVNGDGTTQCLTAAVARKYQQISYKLEDDDDLDDGRSNSGDDEHGGERDKSRGAVQPAVNGNAILPTRTRGAAARPAAGKAVLEESLKKG